MLDRFTRALAIALSLLAISVHDVTAQAVADDGNAAPVVLESENEEHWLVIMLNGQRAGWVHEQTIVGKQQIKSTSESMITIKRGAATLAIEQSNQFIETPAGKPTMAIVERTISRVPMRQVMRFTGKGVTVHTTQNGRTTKRTFPLPKDDFLPPAAAARYLEQQLKAGEKQISFNTLDPSAGLTVLENRLTVVGRENIKVFGKVVPATKVEVVTSALPGVTMIEYLDDEGETIKSTVDLMNMKMVMLLADKKLAQAKVDPPEIIASSMIKMKQPIANARSLRRAVYHLHVNNDGRDDVKIDLPSVASQRVEPVDANTFKLTIDLDNPPPAGADKPGDEHLAATTMLDSKDERIVKLTRRALKGAGDSPAEKAEALRQFVGKHINDVGLDVGYASASEVAETRAGDCTEHGVLLAAMLRAAGIPSRTATGLIYVDRFVGESQSFAYHMWTQAWIADDSEAGGRWVNLDATLPEPYDAAHIVLTTSAMADGEDLMDIIAMVPVFGRLRIELVEPVN